MAAESPSVPATYKPSEFPSLDIALQISRDMLAAQLSHVDSLDTKANFVLGSSTLLTAAAIALRGTTTQAALFVRVGALLAVVAYLSVVGLALLAYMLRKYHQAPNPIDLEPYMWETELRTKGDVLREVVDAYAKNKIVIARKAFWLRISLFAFGGEAVLLAIIAIVQVMS